MVQSTNIPKGTRDFLPDETSKRNYIFDTVKSVFKLYGYSPIETPAMENLSTLLGKYGDEGDKLVFKILNSGDYLKNVDEKSLDEKNLGEITGKISEKGLRYDLTVPFARYVVKNRNELTFPFKRYQIQPVWRADKPQKGRYREFFQCDVDVIGSKSMANEYELVLIINDVFKKLNVKTSLKINNRKILAGLFEILGVADKFIPITVAIDKIEKIGIENVKKELEIIGLSGDAILKLSELLDFKGDNKGAVSKISEILKDNATGKEGIDEMHKIFEYLSGEELFINIVFDLSLARGLNYYTGTIFEVVADEVNIGSICGGGRYDDLTEMFGMKDISGVGISFGAERIFDVMDNLNIFPETAGTTTHIMFVNFGGESETKSMKLANELRKLNISAEVYPDNSKIKKQMQYANKKKVAFVAMIGEEELKEGIVTVKDMVLGRQFSCGEEELRDLGK